MTMTTRPARPARTASSTPSLRQCALDRDVTMRLAATEYDRFTDHVRRLTPEQWGTPTECPGWTVRDMAGHILGMMKMAASIREQRRQDKAAHALAAQRGCVYIDALTSLQVDEHRDLTTTELIEALATTGPKAVKGRKRAPGFIRRRALPVPQPVGGVAEQWTIGFLLDTILTRDPWMHRTDIARATGIPLDLTPEHDGVLVDDVVREWAGRHGRPVHVRLTGPAGGEWSFGTNGGAPATSCSRVDGGPSIDMDAVEFCQLVSGRGSGATGLLTTEVPF